MSHQSATLTLFTDVTSEKSLSLENHNFQQCVEVESRTLSELVLQDEIPYPTVIKMDIEGAEALAIQGMQELLAANPPRLIFLELHPILLSHFSSSPTDVLSLLEKAGYKIKQQTARD